MSLSAMDILGIVSIYNVFITNVYTVYRTNDDDDDDDDDDDNNNNYNCNKCLLNARINVISTAIEQNLKYLNVLDGVRGCLYMIPRFLN